MFTQWRLPLLQVGYFHGFIDGVDYVFVDHPSYHHYAGNIYGGERPEIQFRCECVVCVLCVMHNVHLASYALSCASQPMQFRRGSYSTQTPCAQVCAAVQGGAGGCLARALRRRALRRLKHLLHRQ